MTREEEFEIYKKIYIDVYRRKWGRDPHIIRGSRFLASLKYILSAVYEVDL